MTKYSDIEIQTAENLLKRGFKWITRDVYGAIIAYKIKPDQEKYISGNVICSDLVPIFESIRCGDDPVSLERIVHPQILDDAERRYLKAVIRPFRGRAVFVKKIYHTGYTVGYEQIIIRVKSIATLIADIPLPFFKKGEMYKGMKLNREYTLEELGL
jgi:hypothetical protein